MGVSGSGKTTIGSMLSAQTGIPFFDADDFHPLPNIRKMSQGIPLNDDDRYEWLLKLHELARSSINDKGAIIACSALKEKYRSLLSAGITGQVSWVYLKGSYDLIRHRMKQRKGHYMPEALLQSQFDTLEEPANAFTIDVGLPPEKITGLIREQFNV